MLPLVAALLCCALPISALTPANETKVTATARAQCLEESGLDPEILKRARNGEDLNDRKLGCFGACFLKYFGILNDDGTFNEGKAIEYLPDGARNDDVISMIRTCSSKEGETDCDTARLVFECMRDKASFKYVQQYLKDQA